MGKLRAGLHVLLPTLLAVAASSSVLLNLIVHGPMRWHFGRPEAIEGGAEALLLGTALALLAWRGGRWCGYAMAALCVLYLRRHHVDLPLLSILFAGEVFLAWGLLLPARRGDDGDLWQGLRALAAGLVLWLVMMLLLHAAGWAHPRVLLLAFGVLSVATLILRRRSGLVRPGLRAFAAARPIERAVWALLGTWFLVLLARSNAVVGFDTLWYLSRGSYVLAPNGSFFEPLGLVSAVHYFPKLWELLLLPLDGTGDLSFAVALILLVMAGALGLCALMLRRLGVGGALLPLALLVLATLPAIASTALQLKSDIAAAFFLLLALVAADRWSERQEPRELIWVLIGIGLACCAKLTVVPYAGLLALALCIAALRSPAPIDWRKWRHEPGTVVVALCTLGIGLTLLLRTWLLSGLPTIGPDPLVSLWNLLGMRMQEPAGTLTWLRPQDWSDAPWLLPEALFAPNALPKIRIAWTGNAWLLAAGVALWWGWRRPSGEVESRTRALRAILWMSAVAGLVLLLSWRYHSRGSDGNYFILPVVAASLLAFAAAARAAQMPAQRIGLAALLAICAFWQAGLGFVSAAWSPPGTRTFDLDFMRSPFDTAARMQRERRSAGLDEVAAFLAAKPRATRTVVAGPSHQAHLLPTRVESVEHVLFSRPEYGSSIDSFVHFLRRTCIDYLLIADGRLSIGEGLRQVPDHLPHEMVLASPGWTLYALHTCKH